MDAVARFAREGGPVLGICNGFQVLCEAGLLPGALLPNAGLRFVCRQVDVVVANARAPFTGECTVGEALSIPVKHTTGRFYAPRDARAIEAGARSCSAMPRETIRMARCATSRECATSAATSLG